MRTYISNTAALFALVAFAAENESGATSEPRILPDLSANNAVPPVTAEATSTAKPAAKPSAKRNAAKPSGKPAKPGKAAAKAKPAKAAKATSEAKPDPRAAKAERIAIDRQAVNALYATFEAHRVSVPVKPLSAFKPLSTTAHPIARSPSQRQAAAIALAFAANGKKLGGTCSRVFEINGIRSCLENGVMRDAVSSGLITVSGDSPEAEKLSVTAKAATAIISLIGAKAAKAGKLA